MYLNSIGKAALLNAEQEVELAKRIEAGVYAAHILETEDGLTKARMKELRMVVRDGGLARNHMLVANLRLVVSIANRYQGRMPYLDLVQEGNVGL